VTVELYNVLTIVAIVLGPILAVMVTRFVDNKRADYGRQMDIFRALMRTRNMKISAEHVGALNLVELEFPEHANVVSAWKEYLKNLSEPWPTNADQGLIDALVKRRESLLTKLISEIAKALRFKVEQLDILAGNYLPQDWVDVDLEQRLVRRALLHVLSGQGSLAIRPAANPYPPAPVQAVQPQTPHQVGQ
jgi:hypothetical protein